MSPPRGFFVASATVTTIYRFNLQKSEFSPFVRHATEIKHPLLRCTQHGNSNRRSSEI